MSLQHRGWLAFGWLLLVFPGASFADGFTGDFRDALGPHISYAGRAPIVIGQPLALATSN